MSLRKHDREVSTQKETPFWCFFFTGINPVKSSSKCYPARAYCANNLNSTPVKSDEILIVN